MAIRFSGLVHLQRSAITCDPFLFTWLHTGGLTEVTFLAARSRIASDLTRLVVPWGAGVSQGSAGDQWGAGQEQDVPAVRHDPPGAGSRVPAADVARFGRAGTLVPALVGDHACVALFVGLLLHIECEEVAG